MHRPSKPLKTRFDEIDEAESFSPQPLLLHNRERIFSFSRCAIYTEPALLRPFADEELHQNSERGWLTANAQKRPRYTFVLRYGWGFVCQASSGFLW